MILFSPKMTDSPSEFGAYFLNRILTWVLLYSIYPFAICYFRLQSR